MTPSPSGGSLSGIHSPVEEKGSINLFSTAAAAAAAQPARRLLNKSVSACGPERGEYRRDVVQQREEKLESRVGSESGKGRNGEGGRWERVGMKWDIKGSRLFFRTFRCRC